MPISPPLALVVCSLVCCLASAGLAGAQTQSVGEAADAAPVRFEGGPAPVPPAVITRDGNGRVIVRAVRLALPLQFDGKLDEEIYQSTPSIGGFIQQEPTEGLAATEPTDVWIFFDATNLYISARCWDSQPDRIVANELRRDHNNIFQGDSLTVTLDPFYDRRTGFWFQTNPLGAVRDALVPAPRKANYDWNTVWDVRSQRFDRGWTTEMVIPYKSLRYLEGREQVWSVNFRRVVRSKNEISLLTRVPASYGSQGVAEFASAATLVGVETPSKSRNLEIKPYAISQLAGDRTSSLSSNNRLGADAGVDVKYGLTRSLIFDATYNTDFSQVEADEQQVNLTRFSLKFAEKREFFLEGGGIFDFGNTDDDSTPLIFFSRRIGISNGLAVPILGGARLTGRAGKYSVGALNIQSRDSVQAGALATNFSVMRVRRDVLRRSSIGVLATNRSVSIAGAGANQVFGVDGAFRFYQNVEFAGYYARTRTPGVTGDAESYQALVDYSPDRYGFHAERVKVGEGFKPEVGFMSRQDYVRDLVKGRFSPRVTSVKAIRKIGWETSFERFNDNRGSLESREAQGTFRVDMSSGDYGTLTYAALYEFLSAPFQIARGVVLPVGGYDFRETRASYKLAQQRKVSGTLNFTKGSFYSGNRTLAEYIGLLQPRTWLSVEPKLSFNWVSLPQGRFVTKLVGARATYTMTPRMFVGALLQYSSSANAFSTNVRFRWEYSPGSDLFIVFSEGRNTLEGPSHGLSSRGVAVKFTRLFRF